MQGLPASGKSTRAKELLEADGNAIRLNKDLLRKMLHFDTFTGKNEELTQSAQIALADYFTSHGKNVIVDDTNLNPKVVARWKEFARPYGTKFEIVRMDTSIEECIERDAARNEKVGQYVIKNMARQYRLFPNGKKEVLVDLDGTLADITHRLHFVKQEPKDWKGFFQTIMQDSPRKEVIEQVKKYKDTHNIVIVSARPENYKHDTIIWLYQYLGIWFDTIIMRRAEDKREDSLVKKEILERYFDKENIECVFDDRPRVIRMWREQGLQVVDVGEGVEF